MTRFVRQVLAGYPEFTEDLVRTGGAEQPMQRAVKVTGEPVWWKRDLAGRLCSTLRRTSST